MARSWVDWIPKPIARWQLKRRQRRLNGELCRAMGRALATNNGLLLSLLPEHVDPKLIFFPLMMMAEEQHAKFKASGIVDFYGSYNDAIGDRGINGFPMLSKVTPITAAQRALTLKHAKRMSKALGRTE